MNWERIRNYKPSTIQRILIFLIIIYVLYISDIAGNVIGWVVDILRDISPQLSIAVLVTFGIFTIFSTARFTGQKQKEDKSKSYRTRWTLWGISLMIVVLILLVFAFKLLATSFLK